jgi:lysylphosphatidylglycerol synthetase-like protein (DUF2156 family)
MKIESLIWLFPVIFMLHEFEEIIFLKPWLKRNYGTFRNVLPGYANTLLERTNNFSISAFALIVAEEFILISLFVLISFETENYVMFVALVIATCLHNVFHLAQTIIVRRFIPVIFTSLILLIYGAIVISLFASKGIFYETFGLVFSTLLISLGFGANFIVMHKLAALLDRKFADTDC